LKSTQVRQIVHTAAIVQGLIYCMIAISGPDCLQIIKFNYPESLYLDEGTFCLMESKTRAQNRTKMTIRDKFLIVHSTYRVSDFYQPTAQPDSG